MHFSNFSNFFGIFQFLQFFRFFRDPSFPTRCPRRFAAGPKRAILIFTFFLCRHVIEEDTFCCFLASVYPFALLASLSGPLRFGQAGFRPFFANRTCFFRSFPPFSGPLPASGDGQIGPFCNFSGVFFKSRDQISMFPGPFQSEFMVQLYSCFLIKHPCF